MAHLNAIIRSPTTRRARGATARAALLAALLAACAPRTSTAPEPETVGASAAYTCAFRQLRDLGYTHTRTAPESGTVAGQRIVSRPLSARTEWDEIVVTTPVGASARGAVRAVARGGVEQSGRRRTAAATPRGRKDAATVATRCREASRERRATSLVLPPWATIALRTAIARMTPMAAVPDAAWGDDDSGDHASDHDGSSNERRATSTRRGAKLDESAPYPP